MTHLDSTITRPDPGLAVNSRSPIRVGIVGMGRVGMRRARCVADHPALSLGAVCDLDEGVAGRFPSARFSNNFRDLAADPELDAIIACAYNAVAPEIVCMALDHGKHVFCEKPPGRSVSDVRRMIAAEQSAGRCKLQFGFNHRHHYSVLEAQALVRSGKLGRVLWVRGVYGKCGSLQFENQWRSDSDAAGGGILLDQGIHMLDLCRLFCGEFDEVQALVTTAHWNIPCEDNAFLLMRNRSGQIASVHSSATQWQHRFELEICLEEGYVRLDGILSSTRSYGDEKMTFARKQFEDTARAFGRPREETIVFDTDDSWRLEIEAWARAITHDLPVAGGDSKDALRVMELIERAYEAGRSGVLER